MKKAVNGVYILSVVLIALFSVVLIASIIGKMFYTAPEGSEPLDTILSKGIYNVFIILAIAGVLNSLLVLVCLHSFNKYKEYFPREYNIFKSVPFTSVVLCNSLFYLFAAFIFTSESYFSLAFPIVWMISFIVFAVSLLNWRILYRR